MSKNLNYKFNKSIVFKYILLLLPVFQPKLFTQYSTMSIIYIVSNVMLFVFFILYNIKSNNIKVDKIMILWIMFRLYLLLIMFINNNFVDILQWGYQSLMVINLIFIFQNSKNSKKELAFSIFLIGTILLIFNYFTLIKYPRGIIRSVFYDDPDNDWYLLGIKTQFTSMMFPTIAGALYLYKCEDLNKNMKIKIMLFACLAALINVLNKNIGSAIVGFLLFIMMYIFSKLKNKNDSVNFYKYSYLIYISVFITLLFLFFNIQNLFSWFITNVLNKNVTLSNRIYIWKNAKNIIFNSNILQIIFGHGQTEHFVPLSNALWPAHNQILSLIYNGGIIGFLMFYSLLLKFGSKKNIKNVKLLYILCFCILIMSIIEVYFDIAIVFVPFLILYYLSEVDFNESKKI